MEAETRLFELAKQLYQAAFWEDYWDTDILALQLPGRTDPVFMSILGKTEDNYGFLFYRDLEELRYYFELVKQDQLKDAEATLDWLLIQNGLSLTYENRLDLPTEDYQRIKNSGVPFRGKKAWPLFLDYKPGYYPDPLPENEVPFMIDLLERFMEMAEEYRTELDLYDAEENKESVFLRTYTEDGQYEDSMFVLPSDVLQGLAAQKYAKEPVKVTDFELRRVNQLRIGSSIWELELNYIAVPREGMDEERPRFSIMLMIIDAKSTEILLGELVEFEEIEKIQRLFIKALLANDVKPPTVVVNVSRYHRIASIMGELLRKLDIELVPVYKLPMISAVQNDMIEFFDEEDAE